MPRIERSKILDKFHEMVRRRVPIVGGGAGTGLSAKCEEAGGIDLIIIYNSGRYRMAVRLRRGTARLRQRQRDREGDGGGGAAGREAHTGACWCQRHRSVRADE